MKKKNFRKYLAALPAVIIMTAIFAFSSKEADVSTEQSMKLSYYLVDAGEMLGGFTLSPEERMMMAAAIEGPIRKAAHMTEFGILTLSVWFALTFWTNSLRVLYFSTVVFCVLYAAGDEFHQLFIRGRAGMLSDVFIDSAGILLASLLLLIFDRKNGIFKETNNADRKK